MRLARCLRCRVGLLNTWHCRSGDAGVSRGTCGLRSRDEITLWPKKRSGGKCQTHPVLPGRCPESNVTVLIGQPLSKPNLPYFFVNLVSFLGGRAWLHTATRTFGIVAGASGLILGMADTSEPTSFRANRSDSPRRRRIGMSGPRTPAGYGSWRCAGESRAFRRRGVGRWRVTPRAIWGFCFSELSNRTLSLPAAHTPTHPSLHRKCTLYIPAAQQTKMLVLAECRTIAICMREPLC